VLLILKMLQMKNTLPNTLWFCKYCRTEQSVPNIEYTSKITYCPICQALYNRRRQMIKKEEEKV